MLTVEQWPIDKLIPYARSDGSVVDGHLCLKAAHKLGPMKIPVAFDKTARE